MTHYCWSRGEGKSARFAGRHQPQGRRARHHHSITDTLPQWHRLITKATWVSPAPHRVGSIRAIEVLKHMAATEEVIVWNPYHHLAIRIIESSRQNTGASAEEFRIETTERGCRLTWSTARRPRKPPSWLMRLYARPVIKRVTRRQLLKLRKYIEGRFGPAIHYSR